MTEALASVDRRDDSFGDAELHRLKGNLTLQSHVRDSRFQSEEEPEASFQQALAVARHQEAKSLELRAATSLARLWQGQGKKHEARDLVAPVYNWFTEGFDTTDLKDRRRCPMSCPDTTHPA